MSTEVVTIGCRIPNGYVLEVGYEIVARAGDGVVAQYSRGPKYRRYTLGGSHAHTLEMRRQRIAVPSMLNASPYLNRNVPKDLWEQWLSEHKNSWVIKSGQIFEVKGNDAAGIKAQTVDATAKAPAILQPLDSSKSMVVGLDKVETANFDKA